MQTNQTVIRSATVTIAGKEYVIKALPISKAKQWRAEFQKPFDEIVAALQAAPHIEITNIAGLADVVYAAKDIVFGALELLLQMLYSYSPEVVADAEFIEENGYDEEIMAAVVEVVKLVYPFGTLVGMLTPQPANGAGGEKEPTAG